MVIDMKKDKLVIMDWGGVVESHSEESYLAHNVVKHVLEQFTTEPLPLNFKEVFEQSLMVYRLMRLQVLRSCSHIWISFLLHVILKCIRSCI